MQIDNLLNFIVMATVFGLVFSVWCICVFLWLGQYLVRMDGVRKRLGIGGRKENQEAKTLRLWQEVQLNDDTVTPSGKESFQDRMAKLKSEAGWKSSAKSVLFKVAGISVLGFVIGFLTGGGILIGAGIFLLIPTVFFFYTQQRISKRSELFEAQLVDALGIASRALRAGHPLIGAFQLVSEEIDEPLGGIFFRICQEQALGLDLKDSIRDVAKTAYNSELKLFATAVAIQFQSGGNLADLMDSLAFVIRSRMKLHRRVRVITTQTQFSKRILIALPILMFFFLNIIDPEYMSPFYTTVEGKWLLAGIGGILLIGIHVMNRLSILRY